MLKGTCAGITIWSEERRVFILNLVWGIYSQVDDIRETAPLENDNNGGDVFTDMHMFVRLY